ncbi:hypothetical protein QCA50_001797 [Cerrena zonata]|uniref:PHD-type domain-containing protein n=1 Tax=Cerrena zonata TaxID=2478898 RepID=A0AAW0GMC9_9APHY
MASRRLAISSLLCEDESPPRPVAGPSSHSTPSSSRPTSGFVDSNTYPTSSLQYVNHTSPSATSTHLSPSQSEHRIFHPPVVVSPPIPIPRRNERHGTHSPERRTRMEMFVDDEPPNRVIDHHRDSPSHNYHPPTSPHTRRQSHLDRQQLSLGDRHDAQYQSPPECSYTTSSPVRPPSSSGPTLSPRQYPSFSYSPTRSPHHILLSPTHAQTSPLPVTSQFRHTSTSSDSQYPRAYMAPLDIHYKPHSSPKSSISVQANPFRLTPVHPASFSSPSSAPPFPVSPTSRRVPSPPRHSPVLSRSFGSTTHSPTMPLRHPSNSPTISKSPLDGFGPLEALVQAATEERRRLSGGSVDVPPSVWQGSNRSDSSPSLRAVGASPVLTTGPIPPHTQSPSSSSHSQSRSRSRSAEQTTSPPDPEHHLETTYGQLSTSPTVSSTRHLPNDSLPEISPRALHDGEPPLKRRRGSSDSQQQTAPSAQQSHLPLAQHAPHSPMVRTRALSPVTVFDMRAPVRTTPVEPVVASPVGIPHSPSVSVSGSYQSGLAISPVTPSNLIGPGQPYEPSMFDTTAYDNAAPVPVPRRVSIQHDSQEWLAQQYPSSQSTSSNSTDHVGMAVSHLSTLKLESKSPVPPMIDIRPATMSPVDRRIHLSGPGMSPTHAQRSALDTDIDMEFDFIASSSATSTSKRRAAEHDVDDELLSLVDDKPRPSSKSPSNRSPIPPPETSRKPTSSQVASLKHSHSTSARSPSLSTQADRDSMPPPALPAGGALSSSKNGGRAESAGSGSTQAKKKESGTQKGMARTKQTSKAKPKGTLSKTKPKLGKDALAESATTHLSPLAQSSTTTSTTTTGRGKKGSPAVGGHAGGSKRSASASVATAAVGGAPSRSRSTSVMPGEVGKEGAPEPEEEAVVDDKLYCVCKTPYDEDRVMIACDRCDEWYHTQCVQMPDDEVDLVDQFICPICIANNPGLPRTTYKKRCWAGLKHLNPSSAEACHKPARGSLSKYCSDECGIAHMQYRIEAWGGDKEGLWEGVKKAEKREAVVIQCIHSATNGNVGTKSRGLVQQQVMPSAKPRMERQLVRLTARLEKIARQRDEIRKDMEIVLWRSRLFELAAARADEVNECGWDQRLCFDHDEYAEFGASVFDSYDDAQRENEDAMQVDGGVEDGEWWCKGHHKCERHAGWQKLRQAEIDFEKGTMEAALEALDTQAGDLRKKVDEVNDTHVSKPTNITEFKMAPVKPFTGPNGIAKPKVNGTIAKKGKKRKTDGPS